MLKSFNFAAAATVLGLGLGIAACDRAPIPQAEASPRQQQQQQQEAQQKPQQRPHEGEASFYGSQFNGRKMANGEPFNPNSNSAAHRTLPLGTTAKVTNLENGRSVDVKVEDRGPYARGRVIDLSPRNAEELGMKHAGTAPVRVTPIEVPERDERAGPGGEGRQAQR
ncbi:MAG: septal ring lytic transglycosylase RlpA family protein [Acetobacteraceae bacterium]|nr:septal ring lytic transglycosylase RlpA family protein [Acetobacteraceae bacterium]